MKVKIIKKEKLTIKSITIKCQSKDCPLVVRFKQSVKRKRELIRVNSKEEAKRILFGE